MTGTLLVTSGDFGWGAAGKLKLILDHLPGVRAVGVGGDLGRALLGSVDYIDSTDVGRETLRQVVSSHDVRVALVVGSNDVARALVSLGTPVVFVDSLPYLWTVHDNVPTDAAVYCAQACTVLPRLAWPVLAQIQNLRWIEAIVPAPRRCLGGGGAVLSVGGLHSDSSGDAADCYVRGVLPAVLEGLAAAGVPVAAVCGYLDEAQQALIGSLVGSGVQVGPVTPEGFDRLVRSADLLVTSPGSTTLLQAHAAGQRVLILPPQNVSQVLNAEWFSDGGGDLIRWPAHLFDRGHLDSLRPAGEETAVAYMYSVVRTAHRDSSVQSYLRVQAADLALRVLAEPADRPHLDLLGSRGAHQVAHVTRQMLYAPVSPQPRLETDPPGCDDEGEA